MGKHIYKNCTVKDCNNEHYCRSYCRKHYERYRRNGKTEIVRRENNIGTLAEIFDKYCNKKDVKECWIWSGLLYKQGYGRLIYNREDLKAHRVSYVLNKGEIKDDIFVCHSCDEPSCVNPSHLWLGTYEDNMKDMDNKNRRPKEQYHWKAKLSNEIVKSIKKELLSGERQSNLAMKYNVSVSTISKIFKNKTWRNI